VTALLLRRPGLSQKAISSVCALACAVLVAAPDLVTLFIVLGQGHFVIAYLYRWRAGTVRRRTLIAYLVAVALFGGGYWATGDARLLAAVTSIYFAWHMLTDERYLLGGTAKPAALLEVSPALLMLAAFQVEHLYALDGLFLAAAVGATLWAVRALVGVRFGRPSDRITHYFLGAWVLLCSLYLSGRPIDADTLWGTIILYHYFNWYLFYGLRFAERPGPRGRFLVDVAWINGVMVVGFLIWRSGSAPGLDLWFGREAFYVWTCLHLVFTSRGADLGYLKESLGRGGVTPT
jgi:hypothetical protein